MLINNFSLLLIVGIMHFESLQYDGVWMTVVDVCYAIQF
jgi:hypothetical protein